MSFNIYEVFSRSSNLYHEYQYTRIPKLLELVGEKFHDAEHLCENEREAEKPKKSVEIYYEELLPNDEAEWEDEEDEGEEETTPPPAPAPAPVQMYAEAPYYTQDPKHQQHQTRQQRQQLQRQQQPQYVQHPTQSSQVPSSELIPMGIPPIGNTVQPNYASETQIAAPYSNAAIDNQSVPPPAYGNTNAQSVAPPFQSGIPQAAPLDLVANNAPPDQPKESNRARKRRLKQNKAADA